MIINEKSEETGLNLNGVLELLTCKKLAEM